MNISILTPCFNARQWIAQCVASVQGQLASDTLTNPFSVCGSPSSVYVHHHIQDGGSVDGTVELLQDSRPLLGETYQLTFSSEADNGMYSALNKAFIATSEEIVGHLNADEQYLPGTLQFVAEYFTNHPTVDVLFGAVVVTDAAGNYICSRMPLKPMLLHTQVCHLCTFTASMFFRRSAIQKLGFYFDESFRTAGDADLICRMVRAKLNMATVRPYFSVFMDSGNNLGLSDGSKIEQRRLANRAPKWAQRCSTLVEIHHRLRKLLSGAYHLKPFEYQVAQQDGDVQRHSVRFPTSRWRNQSPIAFM